MADNQKQSDQQSGINFEKGLKDANKKSTERKCPSHLNEMQKGMEDFFELLQVDNQSFNSQDAFMELMKYIANYERILYSTVSHIVYDITDENETETGDRFGTLLSNIEQLVEYVDDDKNIAAHVQAAGSAEKKHYVQDTKKAVWKLWDHVNLAHRQYGELRQSESEYDERFEKRIGKFQSKITGEMNAQLLTMVGIFTALAFVLFGGISSLGNLLTSLREIELLKLLIIGCGWGLGILNVVFVFLFCVGKMTKLNFKSTMSPDATFWQRYPVVCWTDFLMVALMVVFLWLYYCVNRNGHSGLDWLIGLNPTLVSVLGLAVILVVIGICFRGLVKKTRAVVGDEDE